MKAWEQVARALATVEGDPDELVEISTPRGLTRAPAWKLYRLRALAALDAARDALMERIYDRLENQFGDDADWFEGEWGDHVTPEDFKAAWDEATAP